MILVDGPASPQENASPHENTSSPTSTPSCVQCSTSSLLLARAISSDDPFVDIADEGLLVNSRGVSSDSVSYSDVLLKQSAGAGSPFCTPLATCSSLFTPRMPEWHFGSPYPCIPGSPIPSSPSNLVAPPSTPTSVPFSGKSLAGVGDDASPDSLMSMIQRHAKPTIARQRRETYADADVQMEDVFSSAQ